MHLQVNSGDRVPIYRQLMDQIREAAARGKLTPGQRLPSVRAVSRDLVINPNTVAKAYAELERDGVLNTRQGKGVFVAEPKAELTKKARLQRLTLTLDSFLTEAVHLGFSDTEVVNLVADRVTQFQWNQNSAGS